MTVRVIVAGILLAKENIIQGIVLAIEHLIKSVSSKDSIYIVLLPFIFEDFEEIMKVSGGIKGFAELASIYGRQRRDHRV